MAGPVNAEAAADLNTTTACMFHQRAAIIHVKMLLTSLLATAANVSLREGIHRYLPGTVHQLAWQSVRWTCNFMMMANHG